MNKIKLILLTTIILILSLTSITEAKSESYKEHLKQYIQMKINSIKIKRVIIRRLEQNKNKKWQHLKDTMFNIWRC